MIRILWLEAGLARERREERLFIYTILYQDFSLFFAKLKCHNQIAMMLAVAAFRWACRHRGFLEIVLFEAEIQLRIPGF